MSTTTDAGTPRLFGTAPYDHEALSLSRDLRAVLHRAGVVASPDLPTRPIVAPPEAGPVATRPAPTLTRAIIEARLAECTRAVCEDCGCEEYCVDYLRDALAEAAREGRDAA